ncbi:hypothetical protein [Leifsonia poae]|uniref:hypothetical protein n=1 Tax=Leifsonia poae TaxID=110933 RepID=UPI001CC06DA2|nr:hypothetical protein [Leifsonia poae]
MSFLRDGMIRRDPIEQLDELSQDLSATWNAASVPASISTWMSRPSILRRIADALSAELRDDIDRILAVGPGAQALGSAVALATGIPYVAEAGSTRFGDLHRGERVAVVNAVRQGEDALGAANASGAVILQNLAVVDLDDRRDDPAKTALFRFTGRHQTLVTERKSS